MNLNYSVIIRILGSIIMILGLSMIPALITSYIYAEYDVVWAFAICSLALIALASGCLIKTHLHSIHLKIREGYLIVTLCWFCASFFGAMPYVVSGVVPSLIDAFFESVSGFTTTGCTVLDINSVPKGLTMWKAISHWLGGMGILVFVISILPKLGIGGQTIIKAEVPGPTLDKMTTRISDSARILYVTYLSFSLLEFILLSFTSMSTYDAIIHTLGSISTSGLFSHPSGVAYFDSFYVEAIISTFTILASVNFVLYNAVIRGNLREVFSNIELRAFIIILIFAISLVSFALYFYGTYDSLADAFRYGLFQVIAFATTSGYSITDFTQWPTFCKSILLCLLFIGGCAASTCGSVKVIRILVLLKLIGRSFLKRIHPRSVVAVKLGDKFVPADKVSSITVFILLYMVTFLFSSLVLSLQNLDFITTLSTAASLLANTGCSLGINGSIANFSMFSEPLRLFLSLVMIVGRLELFTIIFLISPKFWNPDR